MAMFVNFASYNMRGFGQGHFQLLEVCKGHDIIGIQEHWLPDCDLNKITSLHDEFVVVAKSAMSDKLQPGFLRGRPFGGLALLFRKSVIAECKLIGVATNCRCLAVMIRLHTGRHFLLM